MHVWEQELLVGAPPELLVKHPSVGCKQCQEVWSLLLEHHSFWDVGFSLAGADLGRKQTAL